MSAEIINCLRGILKEAKKWGDMLKVTYDTNASGVVDNSEKLDGNTLPQVRDHNIYRVGSTDNPDLGLVHVEHTSIGISVPGVYIVNRSNKVGDGGVGLKIWNVYNSDAIYIKQDGSSGTGEAIDVLAGYGIQMKVWPGAIALWLYDNNGNGLLQLDSDGKLTINRCVLRTGNQTEGRCHAAITAQAANDGVQVSVCFREEMTNVPSSITLSDVGTTQDTNLAGGYPQVLRISKFGFGFMIRAAAAGDALSGDKKFLTVGN